LFRFPSPQEPFEIVKQVGHGGCGGELADLLSDFVEVHLRVSIQQSVHVLHIFVAMCDDLHDDQVFDSRQPDGSINAFRNRNGRLRYLGRVTAEMLELVPGFLKVANCIDGNAKVNGSFPAFNPPAYDERFLLPTTTLPGVGPSLSVPPSEEYRCRKLRIFRRGVPQGQAGRHP